MATGNQVLYFRVSTTKQGHDGHGINAQKGAVRAFLNGGNWKVVGEFVEVESGKNAERPQLTKAIEACRLYGARLVVAKLDRLSRDPDFLRGLERAGVEFVAADMPNANKLTIGIMALVAEQEREAISARTKAALKAAKVRGKALGGFRIAKTEGDRVLKGSHTFSEADRKAAREARMARGEAQASRVAPAISELQAAGIASANGIAKALNDRGIPAARGGEWSAVQVQRVLARLP